MDAVLPYRAMAYNNGWANHRLLAACIRLPQADFVAPRTGFFPSLRATLNHILIIDRFYVDAMEGGTLGPAAWADPEPCQTAIMLRTAQREVDRRLIAVVERLDMADLDRPVTLRELHYELEELRTEMATGFAELRAYVDFSVKTSRDELRTHFDVVAESLRGDFRNMFDWMKANMTSVTKRVDALERGEN